MSTAQREALLGMSAEERAAIGEHVMTVDELTARSRDAVPVASREAIPVTSG